MKRTDLAAIVPAKPAVAGFADDDGKQVDPRFADASVSDGTTCDTGKVGTEAGSPASAGARTAIASTQVTKGISVFGHSGMIRKFTDGAAATAYIAKVAKDPRFTTKTFDTGKAGFFVVGRDIAGDHIKDTTEAYSTVGKPFQQSSHYHMFVHREQFLVIYSLWEKKRGHNFTGESLRITERTKDLIYDRFPRE